ncbi:putative late blight resistance protein homolog R1A-10 [Salvia splendens]|uniref:putative late blight resistance protein homolog R1A-10 n=1 Tax=Salvia splendens TaxID=180675 RepID=UPI001C2540F9|nr:putative late blight resistance protein homolog R1A-10 [Salvia splendens]
MTAWGAVVSLKNTILHIVNSSYMYLVEPSQYIIQLAYDELQPLQDILKRLDTTSVSKSRTKVNALDKRIKDTIWKFEDSLESLVREQILLQFPDPDPHQLESIINLHRRRRRRRRRRRGYRDIANWLKSRRMMNEYHQPSQLYERDVLLFYIDLTETLDDAVSFIQNVRDTKEEYINELANLSEEKEEEEDDDEESISSRFGLHGTKSKMIGLSDQFQQLKSKVICDGRKRLHALVGMAGVGKTALAREIYEDPDVITHFECRVWVSVGRKVQHNQVSRGILAQMCGATTHVEGRSKSEMKRSLEGKKCLIVVDDVWENQVLKSLISSIPMAKDQSILFLVTARDLKVLNPSFQRPLSSDSFMKVRFLNEGESKELLCHRVFGNDDCPIQLDKAAIKIAKKCEGLPLTIVTVAGILSKSENRNPNYWDKVAEERNSVFTNAYKDISKVLFPSYDYLPQDLKMTFLYMGVFPRDYEISISKILDMFIAGGYHLDRSLIKQNFIYLLNHWLLDLCMYKNLVLFKKKTINWNEKQMWHPLFKTCFLHSSWRYLCRDEARKNKFYLSLNKLVDDQEEGEEGVEGEEGIEGQRGLCLENRNSLFGNKDFYNSIELNCASSARFVLFNGPYHRYPTPINAGFKLLRKLDALKLRFYIFPVEILALVQLKYLALTCNGDLPTSISKLFNLQFLIIHPHINIQCLKTVSYVPIQIWDMQELVHIEIPGKDLVAPYHVASLENLSTLIGVNANICTIIELLRKAPRARKLDVRIELTPYDDQTNLLSFFSWISSHKDLEILKCSITNPWAKYLYLAPPAAIPSPLMLPHLLRKLHLSGMGFPWEYVDVVGSLSVLEVLKLRSYAFKGSKWEAKRGSFWYLKFLMIEDSDLEQWKPSFGSFGSLTYLSMKHCYKLKELCWPSICENGKIELVNCNPLALKCAEQLQPDRTHLEVTATSSFDEKPVTVNFQLRLVRNTSIGGQPH